MNSHLRWSLLLKVVGGIIMLLGTVDPMEGSMLILPGSGLVALGMYIGRKARPILLYWTCVFILITIGVGALFALSSVGGIGGNSGHSMWWGLLIMPYPIGWLMALLGGAIGLVRVLQKRKSSA